MNTFSAPSKGFGLRLGEDIQHGDFVMEYCGEVITAAECGRRIHQDGSSGEGAFYMLALGSNAIIDARPAANLARFANHSCEPNMVMQKWNVLGETRAGLFACQDIAAGTELTWNYQLDSFEGHVKLRCRCGTPSCTGYIGLKPGEVVGFGEGEEEEDGPSSAPLCVARTLNDTAQSRVTLSL